MTTVYRVPVRKGDTWDGVAGKLGLTAEVLKAQNQEVKQLRPGQVLSAAKQEPKSTGQYVPNQAAQDWLNAQNQPVQPRTPDPTNYNGARVYAAPPAPAPTNYNGARVYAPPAPAPAPTNYKGARVYAPPAAQPAPQNFLGIPDNLSRNGWFSQAAAQAQHPVPISTLPDTQFGQGSEMVSRGGQATPGSLPLPYNPSSVLSVLSYALSQPVQALQKGVQGVQATQQRLTSQQPAGMGDLQRVSNQQQQLQTQLPDTQRAALTRTTTTTLPDTQQAQQQAVKNMEYAQQLQADVSDQIKRASWYADQDQAAQTALANLLGSGASTFYPYAGYRRSYGGGGGGSLARPGTFNWGLVNWRF